MIMDEIGAISLHKKGQQPKTGDVYGSWEGRPEFVYGSLPGGEMLSFNLDNLNLSDYNSMRYHPQINASLSVLTFMIHQADWRIECEDARIRDMVQENLEQIWTRLVRAMAQAFWAGFSPAVLEYENDAQGRYVQINKVKDLSPFECSVKWKKTERTINGRTHNHYTYDGITQYGYGDIPAMNTFWYPVLRENGDYGGRKLLKPAFAPWYFSQLMHIYTNRYFERFGEPLPIGRAPFDEEIIEPSGKRYTGKQIMEEVIAGIRSRGSVVLPSSIIGDKPTGTPAYEYNIEYLESNSRGVDFERYLTRLDEEMSLALFTPLLLLRNADVGSHNLGVQHTQTYLWELNALLGDMKEYIDRFICQRLKEINFSAKAPRCEWVPNKMGKESVETIRAMVVELIRGDKVKPNIDELGVQLGMSLEEIQTVVSDDPDEPMIDPNSESLDPMDDSDAPVPDNRQRTERSRSRSTTRTVGSDGVPGTRTITARVRSQVANSWGSGIIQIDPLNNFERSTLLHLADPIDSMISALHGLPTEEFESVDMMMNIFNGGLSDAEKSIELKDQSTENFARASYRIPDEVKNNAISGLALRKKFGRGGTSVGENTARTLAQGGSIGIEKVRHIARYFPRHAGDNLDDKTSNGWIAWQLWGGYAGQSWSSAIVKKANSDDKKAS